MTKHADAVVSAAPLRLWLDYEFAISSCLVVFTSTNISISQQKLLVFCICLFLLICALKTWDRCRMAASSKDWNCICRRFVSIGGEVVTYAQYWRQRIINIYFVIANQSHHLFYRESIICRAKWRTSVASESADTGRLRGAYRYILG